MTEEAPKKNHNEDGSPVSSVNWNDQNALESLLENQYETGSVLPQQPSVQPPISHCSDECESAHRHVRVSRSWRSVLPHLILYFVACFLTVALSREFPELVLVSTVNVLGGTFQVAMPLLGLIAAVLLVRPLFLMYDTNHKITCHHIRSTSGICSLRKTVVDMPFENLKGVGVNQSLLERILNVGTIVVWTAMTSSPELSMNGVGNPEYYVGIIRSRLDEVHTKQAAA